MQIKPQVSVLVTVYNRESYLAACLDSILASTWQDFEVVVVDDYSTDGSVALAEAYAARDQRIRFYRNPRNLGDYPNRNRAAELAVGKYLKYLDADDLIYPHSLGLMGGAMEAHPEAALGLSLNQADPELPYPFMTQPAEAIHRHFEGRSLLGGGPSGAIMCADAFRAVGGFSGRQFVGDCELWLKLAESWPLVSLPPALIWWRQHEGQQMHLERSRPQVLNVRFDLEQHALQCSAHLTGPQKAVARRRLRHNQARKVLSIGVRQFEFAVAWNLYRGSGLRLRELLGGLSGYR